ncbi:MAG: hypothetical protein ACJAZ9_001709 [Neolewinella sp.]|jgi:hypothetical protein
MPFLVLKKVLFNLFLFISDLLVAATAFGESGDGVV